MIEGTMDPTARALMTKRLSDAEEAYHNLMVGGMAKVFVDQNGERVEFSASSALGLTKYIFSMKSQLGLLGNVGPIQPWM